MPDITKKCGEELKAYPAVKYTWRIENFSKHDWLSFFSDSFLFEGHNWNLFLDRIEDPEQCFLIVGVKEKATTPLGVEALVTLTMIDQLDHNESKTVKTFFTFHGPEDECGSEHPFLSSELLHDEQKGYVLNDTCIIEVELMTLNTSSPFLVEPICIDYVLHSETMDSIHAKAKSFLQSSSSSSTDESVKLLEKAVETEEGKLDELGMLRKRHDRELEEAAKEWDDFADQTFGEEMDGFSSLFVDFDKFVKTLEGAIEDAGKRMRELRRRGGKVNEAVRREAQVLIEERVEASRRTQLLLSKIMNLKVSTMSNKSEDEEWVQFT